MESNNNFSNNMNTLFSKLEDYVKHESMMGNPMTVENKTLVPIVSVALGYGSGNNSPKNNQTTNAPIAAEGIGLGARISTDAVVVIDNNSVSMLPVTQKNDLNQMMDKIPNVINSLKGTNANQSQQGNATPSKPVNAAN